MSRPTDTAEREAERAADTVMHGEALDGVCTSHAAPSAARAVHLAPNAGVHRFAGGPAGPTFVAGPLRIGGGVPLDPVTRGGMERHFHADLTGVRIHAGAEAAEASRSINASAFTIGSNIAFGRGQYSHSTPAGRRLLAHELAHVVQGGDRVHRQAEGNASPVTAASTIAEKVRVGDVAGVANELEMYRGAAALAPLRVDVRVLIGQPLERWLAGRLQRRATVAPTAKVVGFGASVALPGVGALAALAAPLFAGSGGPDAERGLRIVWPVLSLVEKMQVYDEGYRELEQAQIDIVRSATPEQRTAARAQTAALEAIYRTMEPTEEFEVRKLIDGTPDGLYQAAAQLLRRAPGFFSDDEDSVFAAMLDLPPSRRKQFFSEHVEQLYRLLSVARFKLLSTLCSGTEAQALIARLRMATEGRIDDAVAVAAVVDRAVGLLRERNQLRATVDTLPTTRQVEARARLAELDDLDTLLRYTRAPTGELDGSTFLGMLAGARGDASSFAADANRLAQFAPKEQARQTAFEVAKQRILLSEGDVGQIKLALVSLQVPQSLSPGGEQAMSPTQTQAENEKLRRELLADPAVADVIRGLTDFERMRVNSSIGADEFDAKLADVNEALQAAQWGRFFHLILEVSRHTEWVGRFQKTASDPFGVYANVFGAPRRIMEEILDTRHIPLLQLLEFFGGYFKGGAGGFVIAVDDIDEIERERLRRGYSLTVHPPIGPPTATALEEQATFRDFQAKLSAAFRPGTDDYQRALWAVLGSVPAGEDWTSDEGRFNAAQLMYDQQSARLGVDRGLAQYVTETDETMVAAAREFAAKFEPLRSGGAIKAADFALLALLHERFLGRAAEFTDASSAIADMAGMIAATVAGIVVVAATGGAATPGVIALAAASGAGARVVTKEMFGAAYADVGARDLLLGAVDGALAVVGSSLGAKGAELVGLGGHALTAAAARTAGEVASEASEVALRSGVSLSRRVASSAVEAALDGAFSGAVSEAIGTMTTPGIWRRGVWRGLVEVGQAALIAGLTGLATGVLAGGALPVAGAAWARLSEAIAIRGMESAVARVGMSEALTAAKAASKAGDSGRVNQLLMQIETHLSTEETAILRRTIMHDLFAAIDRDVGEAVLAVREAQGHLYKVTETGRIVRCTNCDDYLALLDEYRHIFARRADYVDRLTEIENLAKRAKEARAARDPSAVALADSAAQRAAELFHDVRLSAGVEGELARASTSVPKAGLLPSDVLGAPSPAQVTGRMQSLASERVRLGLPVAGSSADASTVCRLDIGSESFFGVNAHGEPINLVVNAQTATHAEGGAFQRAAGSVPASRETTAVLYVDRELCRACGDFAGVSSVADQLGILQLDIYTPSGLSTRFSFATHGR